MSLTGQRVLIMGGGSGIGAAAAALFAARGAEVVITGRTPDRLDAAAASIEGKVTARRVDAASEREVADFFAEDVSYDHLVLAVSGGSGAGPFAGLDLDALRGAFEAKVFPQLRVLQAALPRLTASATLVTASSARAALPGTAGLAAVNGALEAAVRPLAVELAPLRVNAVSPGVIDTPWWDAVPAERRAAMFAASAAALPVGRVGRPEEPAEAIVFAATNGFVTGQVIEVNGGLTLPTGRP
ncbi:SDR family oxidoreductase [Actinomadura atramentaria]|uniref:SDR family oxidoreductase n=1 Tax=Actinomadura atramentaria TaxID=1990 RepID=UPI00039D850E|nr:SDR family oxidoreductase [Actinomadura atramentaria]